MKQFYMVMGDFDFVGICEAPDDAVMARYVSQLGDLGFVRTKTLKAFPEAVEGATDDCRSTVWVLLVRALA
jgi:uncharacterized protein with GYD domain